MHFLSRILILIVLLSAMILPASAKRVAPEPVVPVIFNSVEYSAPFEFMGFVVATDVNDRKVLWKKRIYSIHYIPYLETDVQDVFITSLSIEGNDLIIRNEDDCKFSLNLTSRKVSKIKAC
jgi:hypothetical protein